MEKLFVFVLLSTTGIKTDADGNKDHQSPNIRKQLIKKLYIFINDFAETKNSSASNIIFRRFQHEFSIWGRFNVFFFRNEIRNVDTYVARFIS